MSQPKRPIEVVPGPGARWTGWQKPLERLFVETKASIHGIRDRVEYAAMPALKAAFRSQKVFLPEINQAFSLDALQNGTTALVNYVLHDANTYEIPFVFSGNGVFVARFLKVATKQRLWVPGYGTAMQMAVGYNGRFPGDVAGAWTTKFSIFPRQPGGPDTSGTDTDFRAFPALNFFWSMRDNTGWQISDNLQSHVMLQPNTLSPVRQADGGLWTVVNDGGLYEFDTPWAFERDGQCVFMLRPTTPILQFDSSLAGNSAMVGLPFDDRESGKRNQAVTITVEMHGSTFLSVQDAIKAGAFTRIRRGEPG